jgi:hypothetical protein
VTRRCEDSIATGRLRKATQFFDAAADVADLADDQDQVRDAVVTLLVHAGIAAADVITCKALGEYAISSESHHEAADLLARVRTPDGQALSRRLKQQLLAVKTKATYTHRAVTATERKQAQRAAEQLVQAARTVAAAKDIAVRRARRRYRCECSTWPRTTRSWLTGLLRKTPRTVGGFLCPANRICRDAPGSAASRRSLGTARPGRPACAFSAAPATPEPRQVRTSPGGRPQARLTG